MKSRRVIVGLVVLVLVGVAAVALRPCGPRPCRATFEQVREGMTYENVCATVGGPPGVYSSRSRYTFVSVPPPAGCRHYEWRADDEVLYVVFDASTGAAVFAHRFDPPRDGQSLLQWVRDRLGL
jgi:hypothetical protein